MPTEAAKTEKKDPTSSPAQERQQSDAAARIQELDRRNKELERALNMDRRLTGIENTNQQIAAHLGRKEEPTNEWTPFLEPKMQPILKKVLEPYTNAIGQLADSNDKLQTKIDFDEYKDPEVAKEVDDIRQQRFQQTGIWEPRSNIIYALRGQNPERFKKKQSASAENGEEETTREERSAPAHTEGASNVGSTRAQRPTGKTAEESTVEEMEKFMSESNMKF